MNDVFISYSRRDKVFVQKLYDCLTAANRSVWADWDSIPAASDWFAEIKQGIQETDSVVFVLSPEWIKSNECRKELNYAIEMGKRLFPILYIPVDPKDVPTELGKINWVYLRDSDDFDKGFQTLCSAMDTDLDWIKTHTRIQVRALEWEKKNRSASFALRGEDLTEGEQFVANGATKSPVPTHLQSEYILASRTDATRRQRQTLAGVIVALVVSIALGIVAFFQRQEAVTQRATAVVAKNTAVAAQATAVANEKEAKRQAQIALARQLASQAQLINSNTNSNQLTAVLLAIQSMKLNPNSEASTLILNNNLAAKPILRLKHGDPVGNIVFSPDGKYLAANSSCFFKNSANCDFEKFKLNIWDTKSGKEVNRFAGRIDSVAFVPDGKYVVFWGCDEFREEPGCLHASIKVDEVTTGENVFSVNSNADETFPGLNYHGYHLSSDGKFIAVPACNEKGICADDTIELWDIFGGGKIMNIKGDAAISSFSFSPDVKYIATVDCYYDYLHVDICTQQFVHIWDIGTGNETIRLPFEVPVTNLVFSPNGEYLAVGGDQFTHVWEVSNWSSAWTANTGNEQLLFSLDSQYVMNVSQYSTSSLWQTATGDLVAEVEHGRWFSPDGQYIVSRSPDLSSALWDPLFDNMAISLNIDGFLFSGAFSPDSKYFVGGSSDGTARAWELSTKQEVARMTHDERVNSIAFSPDGKHVASGSSDGTVRVWEIHIKREILYNPQRNYPYARFIQDKYIIEPDCSNNDERDLCINPNTISTWEISTGRKIKSVKFNTAQGEYIPKEYSRIDMFSPDGRYVLSTDCEDPGEENSKESGCQQFGESHIWDVVTGREVIEMSMTDKQYYIPLAFSPDSKYIYWGGCNEIHSAGGCLASSVQKWQIKPWKLVFELPFRNDLRYFAVASPGGRYLVVPASNNNYLIDAWEGKELANIISNGEATALVFSPDDHFLATGSSDGIVRLWETATGAEFWSGLHGVRTRPAVVFSPDGRYLASYDEDDKAVRVWNVSTGLEESNITRDDGVSDVAFSPDGKYMASIGKRQSSAYDSNVMHIWEFATRKEVFEIANGEFLQSDEVLFSPDGKFVINAGYIWPLESERIISDACAYLPRNLTRAEWEQFIGDAMSYQAVCENLPIEPAVSLTPTAMP